MPLFELERKEAGEEEIKSLLIRAHSKTGARIIAKNYNGDEWLDPEKVTIKDIHSFDTSEILIVTY